MPNPTTPDAAAAKQAAPITIEYPGGFCETRHTEREAIAALSASADYAPISRSKRKKSTAFYIDTYEEHRVAGLNGEGNYFVGRIYVPINEAAQ